MRLLAALLMLLPVAVMAAPPVVTSAGPDKVAVTIYRDPDRSPGGEIDKDNPSAFALIAETRTVDLPPGEVVIRFEGVAGGIVPQSAILFGSDPRERNRDAALLSQKGLLDHFTGQRVILRRTDPATGKTVEESALLRSSEEGVVLQTPRGVEAVYCSGLSQALLFPEAPKTLSAKPVLSMQTKPQPGGKATITLAYIATGFDWEATYNATLSPDGQSMRLFAWLTMASGDETSFINATLSAVAGKVNRSDETNDDTGEVAREDAESYDRSFGCWPQGTTSDPYNLPVPPGIAAPMAMDMADAVGEIIVTARKREESLANVLIAITAVAENLGDLKLYRVPIPVTVAAQSQKQVAFLNQPEIKGELFYRSFVHSDEPSEPEQLFRFQNKKSQGAGLPLPMGSVVIYQPFDGRPMLMGETTIGNRAPEEEIELEFGEPSNLTIETKEGRPSEKKRAFQTTVRNANPFPIRYEVSFRQSSGIRLSDLPSKLVKKYGARIWRVTIPANDAVTFGYTVSEIEEKDD